MEQKIGKYTVKGNAPFVNVYDGDKLIGSITCSEPETLTEDIIESLFFENEEDYFEELASYNDYMAATA
jgi:hypothetical protein